MYGYTAETETLLAVANGGFPNPLDGTQRAVSRASSAGIGGTIGGRLRVFVEDAINAAKSAPTPSATKDAAPPGYGAHPNEVFMAPTNTWGASLKAAYWLAIAGRLGYTSLTNKAVALCGQFDNDVLYSLPGMKRNFAEGSGAINEVIQRAAADIDSAGGRSDARLVGIYTVLGRAQVGSRQELTRDVRAEASPSQIPQKIGQDIVDTSLFFRGIFTGEKPPWMDESEWFWKKWGIRFAIGGLATGALLFVGRPYIELARDLFVKKDEKDTTPTQANRRPKKNRRSRR
jgi:hypothetical protein